MKRNQFGLTPFLGWVLVLWILLGLVRLVFSYDWKYSKVAKIELKNDVSIHFYDELFWEFSRTIRFDVEVNGSIVEEKQPTELWLEGNDKINSSLFRVQTDQNGSVFVIWYRKFLCAVFDCREMRSVQIPPSGKFQDLPDWILLKLETEP